MVDPKRGTRVAVAFPVAAAVLLAAWVARGGVAEAGDSLVPLAGLIVVAALAERIAIQLGPRSWYTPTTPVIVLAALLGGPPGGALVAAGAQAGATGTVWRKRAAGAGLAGIQGIAAGVVGLHGATTPGQAVALAAGALAAAVAVNSAGRWLILVERRATPLGEVWLRGAAVDVVEGLLAAPILAALLLVAPASDVLVVTVLGSLLAGLAIAQRMRETTIAALEAEQDNARRDPLTKAPNRRAFEELLVHEHARIVRGDQPAGLFVVDLDHFKAINDRFGHGVGDDVLVGVVRRLQEGLRATDVVARWGGEEITVLAPGIRSRRGLEQFAERIRRLVGDVPVTSGRQVIAVTVSVGGTLLDGSLSPGEAVHRADAAMYEAKRQRDSWIVSLPPRLTLRAESA